MKLILEIAGKDYTVGLPGYSIAIGLDFDGPQPNIYHVARAFAKAYEYDGWVGDVRRGGSCNFETYNFTPHCNGTHTECIGHLTSDRLRIYEQLKEAFIPAQLISIVPRSAAESSDSYYPGFKEGDRVIDRALLEDATQDVGKGSSDFFAALVIRTLPNDHSKKEQDYMKISPAFFTLEAMEYIRSIGTRHLLVDLPSVDRLSDEGKLSSHHLHWEISKDGAGQLTGERMFRTITEMVFVPSTVGDGHYLLNLQIAPFLSDAAPSNPVLFDLKAL